VLVAEATIKAGVGRFDLRLGRLLLWAGQVEREREMGQGEREKALGRREKGERGVGQIREMDFSFSSFLKY
jgi:hypothetical protein